RPGRKRCCRTAFPDKALDAHQHKNEMSMAKEDLKIGGDKNLRHGNLGLGIPLDIGGTVETKDGSMVFVFERATNWGGVEVSYAHFDESRFGHFEPGQRVKGTIVPDLEGDVVII